MSGLTHINGRGRAQMVDISRKAPMLRIARAEGFIRLLPETVALIREGKVPKGDVPAVARLAGIQGAKATPALIPLCHPLQLTRVEVDVELQDDGVKVTSEVSCVARTGVEMEALAAVSIALLSIYDMCKAVDKTMTINGVRMVEKVKMDAND